MVTPRLSFLAKPPFPIFDLTPSSIFPLIPSIPRGQIKSPSNFSLSLSLSLSVSLTSLSPSSSSWRRTWFWAVESKGDLLESAPRRFKSQHQEGKRKQIASTPPCIQRLPPRRDLILPARAFKSESHFPGKLPPRNRATTFPLSPNPYTISKSRGSPAAGLVTDRGRSGERVVFVSCLGSGVGFVLLQREGWGEVGPGF